MNHPRDLESNRNTPHYLSAVVTCFYPVNILKHDTVKHKALACYVVWVWAELSGFLSVSYNLFPTLLDPRCPLLQGNAAGSELCAQSTALGHRGKWGPGGVTDRPSLPTELKNHWAREKGPPPHGRSSRGAAGSRQGLRQTVPTQYGELWNILMSFPCIRLAF